MNSAATPHTPEQQLRDMNEALLVSSVRQHELAEQALQAERKMHVSEVRYRRLFESAKDGILILDACTGKITDANAFMGSLMDMETHELLGKELHEMGLLKDKSAIEAVMRELREKGFVRYEHLPLETSRGRRIEVEVVANVYRQEHHSVIQCNFRDITERKQAEEALRKSDQRFRALFELGPVAVYSCDAAGVILEFNRRAAELWGREPKPGDTDERFCGSFKMCRPDGDPLPHEQCPMADVLSGGIPGVENAEVIIERPNGSRVTVVVNIRGLKNESGEITGALNCFYDITERKHAEKVLRDADRRKNEFLAMLAHELRNPLAPISNSVQLLRLQKDENRLQHQARTVIERQVTQLTRLIDDLMEVSRITTGRVQLRLDRVEVRGVVERAVETVRPLLDQHRHEFTVSLPPQPIWLDADAARLEQVVVNLLTNAAKYTGEGGHIWLTVEWGQPEECVLRVRDTGVGIAPDFLPRIFDLFTQAERSLDRSQGGLGIGLALVQRLVEMHGGKVEAHSDVGKGSEFIVRLPVALSPALSPIASKPDAREPTKSSLRILVVDDNVDTAESLALLLEESGHDVRMAHDGITALDAALDYHPHIALVDIGLPGLNGYELAKRMRQDLALHDTVLVAMTGYGQETDRQQSEQAGFDHYLVKPADFNKVRQILATVSNSTS